MSVIRRIPNHEHTAIAVAAIRARWAEEASFHIGPAAASNVVKIKQRTAASRVVAMRRKAVSS